MKYRLIIAAMGVATVAVLAWQSYGDYSETAAHAMGTRQASSSPACVLEQATSDNGSDTFFRYTPQGYITELIEHNKKAHTQRVTSYVYNQDNQVIRLNYYTENYSHALESASHTVYSYTNGLLSRGEHYTKKDNILFTEDFTYDTSNRLIGIRDTDGNSTTFVYDKAGNVVEAKLITGPDTLRIAYANYDDRPTPFSAVKGYLNPYSPSLHNPGAIATYAKDTLIARTTYRYQYNSDGVPTRILATSADGNRKITALAYKPN